jgi:CelD/BcsL family acetyltransferase involved in cellulose biosynthesis
MTITRSPARARLACSLVSDAAELERLAPAWLDLLGRSACNEPVLSPPWVLSWWRVFGPLNGRRLRAACFQDGDRLVGLAPLLCRRHWHRPGIPFRRLEPLGTGERPADGIYPDYLNVIAERGAEPQMAEALAGALAGGAFGGWDEFVVPAMAGDSPMLPCLVEALRGAGLACRQRVTGSAPYIPLPATWDDYLRQLPSSRRYYLRQSLRRFEGWADGADRLHRVEGPAELAEGKRVLVALHQERWGRLGKFGSPRFAAFHDAVLPALLAAGALELLWLSVRGEPVAAIYNIVWDGKVYFYQGGRKLDVPRGVRPGIALHAHAIRGAIEARRREYDFLSGSEHYKGQMALAARPVVELRAARPCFVERARGLAEGGFGCARVVRDALRAAWGRLRRPTGRPPAPAAGAES